jgi:mono/diheme cytochrome c family protein
MEALHQAGGVPPGWKFSLPPGNAAAGRKVFIDLGCYSCHEVKGEQFPTKPGEKRDAGPELTGVGSAHPTEYFAEAIVNPNSVVLEGPGFTGPDGLSKMPTFNEDMTVAQLIDLIAYLKSLTAGGHQPAPPSSAPSPKKEPPTGGHRMH